MPLSIELLILPVMISNLKGLNTTMRNSTVKWLAKYKSCDDFQEACTVDIYKTITMSN